jgi:hypothetical protein
LGQPVSFAIHAGSCSVLIELVTDIESLQIAGRDLQDFSQPRL